MHFQRSNGRKECQWKGAIASPAPTKMRDTATYCIAPALAHQCCHLQPTYQWNGAHDFRHEVRWQVGEGNRWIVRRDGCRSVRSECAMRVDNRQVNDTFGVTVKFEGLARLADCSIKSKMSVELLTIILNITMCMYQLSSRFCILQSQSTGCRKGN